MSTAAEVARIAHEILSQLIAARDAGHDLRRLRQAIGLRLRTLLTLTDPATGPLREARLTILSAIRRTEVGDQIRRSGGCHFGAERTIELPAGTDLDLLADGLRQMAESAEDGSGNQILS